MPGISADLKYSEHFLVVTGIVAAREELPARGVKVSNLRQQFSAGVWKGGSPPGREPARRYYASFADFADPEASTRTIQEIGTPAASGAAR